MTREDVRRELAAGAIETVVLAIPDLLGRLVGKRLTTPFFLASIDGVHMCDYLFTVDPEGTPVPGFASSSWETGYGDFVVVPDFETWRPAPWLADAALVLGDCRTHHGEDVETAPRTVLRRQVEAARQAGCAFKFASELEFYLYEESYDACLAKDYRGLTPCGPYSQDYNLLRTSRAEPLLVEVRRAMAGMGFSVEAAKGEWGPGQHEITLAFGDPLANADQHVLFKHVVKEIAAAHGMAATFMAKPSSEVAGSSCHIHASLWSVDGLEPRSADADGPTGVSEPFAHFIAGVLAHAREATLLFAPTINSYRRFQAGSFAPTRISWGRDNRTVVARLVGEGAATRIELRLPGADANPYLAFAGMIAAGLDGVRRELPLPAESRGNAYADASLAAAPASLAEAADLLERSETLRAALGEAVVDHLVHAARWEAAEFAAHVGAWEKRRLFERI